MSERSVIDEPAGLAIGDSPATAARADGVAPSFQVLLHDVPLELSVELGRVTLNLRELAARLGPGSVIPLNKLTGDKLDVRVNNRLVARAEAVAVGERLGVRIVEIVAGGEGES
jgi:flagellar motor switch protein FliN/FliY